MYAELSEWSGGLAYFLLDADLFLDPQVRDSIKNLDSGQSFCALPLPTNSLITYQTLSQNITEFCDASSIFQPYVW
jgi:hypothetical protein